MNRPVWNILLRVYECDVNNCLHNRKGFCDMKEPRIKDYDVNFWNCDDEVLETKTEFKEVAAELD